MLIGIGFSYRQINRANRKKQNQNNKTTRVTSRNLLFIFIKMVEFAAKSRRAFDACFNKNKIKRNLYYGY